MSDLDFRTYWDNAFTWEDYLNREVHKLEDLWRGVYARSVVPDWALERATKIGGAWRMLVISEDWCGDASNTVPVMARMAEVLPNVQIRVVKRDENPELMDAFLTSGSRSIPMAILLRPDDTVAGAWGPRPAELQEFVLREKKAAARPVDDIYRDVRRWYARDRGETTIRAILDIMAAG
jgi:Thioredoxin